MSPRRYYVQSGYIPLRRIEANCSTYLFPATANSSIVSSGMAGGTMYLLNLCLWVRVLHGSQNCDLCLYHTHITAYYQVDININTSKDE